VKLFNISQVIGGGGGDENNSDTGGEFISRRIDEPIRRMIGGIQDPSCCL
jgi:hypothetical protein